MLLRTETKLLLREPVSVLLGILAPLVILVGISFLPEALDPSKDLGGLRAIDTFVPTLSVFAIASLGLITLPNMLANYRSQGVLKRLRTTPASPRDVVVVQLALNTTLGLVALIAVTAVGRLAFDVPLPDPALGWLVAVVLATTSLLSLGMVIAAVATEKVAESVGPALWFPLMFFGGLWVPRPQMSDGLRDVSDLTPVGSAVGALQDVTTNHAFPDAKYLLVMVVWTLVATTAAVRLFRWE